MPDLDVYTVLGLSGAFSSAIFLLLRHRLNVGHDRQKEERAEDRRRQDALMMFKAHCVDLRDRMRSFSSADADTLLVAGLPPALFEYAGELCSEAKHFAGIRTKFDELREATPTEEETDEQALALVSSGGGIGLSADKIAASSEASRLRREHDKQRRKVELQRTGITAKRMLLERRLNSTTIITTELLENGLDDKRLPDRLEQERNKAVDQVGNHFVTHTGSA